MDTEPKPSFPQTLEQHQKKLEKEIKVLKQKIEEITLSRMKGIWEKGYDKKVPPEAERESLDQKVAAFIPGIVDMVVNSKIHGSRSDYSSFAARLTDSTGALHFSEVKKLIPVELQKYINLGGSDAPPGTAINIYLVPGRPDERILHGTFSTTAMDAAGRRNFSVGLRMIVKADNPILKEMEDGKLSLAKIEFFFKHAAFVLNDEMLEVLDHTFFNGPASIADFTSLRHITFSERGEVASPQEYSDPKDLAAALRGTPRRGENFNALGLRALEIWSSLAGEEHESWQFVRKGLQQRYGIGNPQKPLDGLLNELEKKEDELRSLQLSTEEIRWLSSIKLLNFDELIKLSRDLASQKSKEKDITPQAKILERKLKHVEEFIEQKGVEENKRLSKAEYDSLKEELRGRGISLLNLFDSSIKELQLAREIIQARLEKFPENSELLGYLNEIERYIKRREAV